MHDADLEELISKDSKLKKYENSIYTRFGIAELDAVFEKYQTFSFDYAIEKYEQIVHLTDYVKKLYHYGEFLNGKEYSFYYEYEFEKFKKRKNNRQSDYWKYLTTNHKFEIEEFRKLTSFDRKVLPFGRRNGWLSICETNQLESFICDYRLAKITTLDNREFNKVLTDNYLSDLSDKYQFLKDLLAFIREAEYIKNSVSFFINQMETNIKYFREGLLEELHYEIYDFVNIEKEIIQSDVGTYMADILKILLW